MEINNLQQIGKSINLGSTEKASQILQKAIESDEIQEIIKNQKTENVESKSMSKSDSKEALEEIAKGLEEAENTEKNETENYMKCYKEEDMPKFKSEEFDWGKAVRTGGIKSIKTEPISLKEIFTSFLKNLQDPEALRKATLHSVASDQLITMDIARPAEIIEGELPELDPWKGEQLVKNPEQLPKSFVEFLKDLFSGKGVDRDDILL